MKYNLIAKLKALVSRNALQTLIFTAVLALAAVFRFWAAPLSAGQDVAQFWVFAQVFHAHGLDFYRYADAKLDIFPYYGWGFFYPPVWLLILGLALLFVPGSLVANHMIDTGWRVAVKTPVIAADLAIGALIYWAVPGSKLRKLLFASLWLFHPSAWFESSVFGQFDAIAVALLLAALILLMRGRDRLAFLMAGLAIMTKQHTILAVAMMVIISARNMDRRRLLANGVVLLAPVVALSIPFLSTGNFYRYARSLFLPGGSPGYQDPLCFAFSGSGAVVTHLHNVFGWETSGVLNFNLPLLAAALAVTAILCYRKNVTLLQGALAGFLVFTGLHYRVNYQYLIIFIPLALLQAALTHYRSERIYALTLAVLPAIWLWITNVPWWFIDFDPKYTWVTPILTRIGWPERYLPDYTYVTLAVSIMCLSLGYVVLVFARWQGKPLEPPAAQLPATGFDIRSAGHPQHGPDAPGNQLLLKLVRCLKRGGDVFARSGRVSQDEVDGTRQPFH